MTDTPEEGELVDEGLTVCLFCEARFPGACNRSLHWDEWGRCRSRQDVRSGELIEGRDGVLRVHEPRPS